MDKLPADDKNTFTSNWEGWCLDLHSFDGEFDESARERMVKGGKKLLSFLKKYKPSIGKNILEVGPFFSPLMTPNELNNHQTLVYWENDSHAINWLTKNSSEKAYIVKCDINLIGTDEFYNSCKHSLPNELLKFDAVVISQVINYIDYKNFVRNLILFLNPGSLIFINNVVNYGIPVFFSPNRPSHINETIQTFVDCGFVIVEKHILERPRPTDNKRLIFVAQLSE